MKAYLDTADISEMRKMLETYKIDGITTNPLLAMKSGVKDYWAWAKEVVSLGVEVSLEVLDPTRVLYEAERLCDLGDNVVVKVPCRDNTGDYNLSVIEQLIKKRISINITCVCSNETAVKLLPYEPDILSVFVGRMQDAGCSSIANELTHPNTDLLWASCRSAGDYYRANVEGWDIITMSPELITKLHASFVVNEHILEAHTCKEFWDVSKKYYTLKEDLGL
jgi:transaldolase